MDGEGFYPVTLVEELREEATSLWFAEHPDLPGCHSIGDSPDDAMARLDAAREAWLPWARSHEVDIPTPSEDPRISIIYARRDVTQAHNRQTALDGEVSYEDLVKKPA